MKTVTPKIAKGQYGYMDKQRKRVIITTISYYAISLAIFAMGYITTGSKRNLLTIVAVLGLLPASKSAVQMIMFLKAPRFSAEVAEILKAQAEGVDCAYELVLTTYETTFPITCVAVRDHSICAYSEFTKCNADAFEEHVKKMLKQDGYHDMTVKLMSDQMKFINRLHQMTELSRNGKEQNILQMLCDISL